MNLTKFSMESLLWFGFDVVVTAVVEIIVDDSELVDGGSVVLVVLEDFGGSVVVEVELEEDGRMVVVVVEVGCRIGSLKTKWVPRRALLSKSNFVVVDDVVVVVVVG